MFLHWALSSDAFLIDDLLKMDTGCFLKKNWFLYLIMTFDLLLIINYDLQPIKILLNMFLYSVYFAFYLGIALGLYENMFL